MSAGSVVRSGKVLSLPQMSQVGSLSSMDSTALFQSLKQIKYNNQTQDTNLFRK